MRYLGYSLLAHVLLAAALLLWAPAAMKSAAPGIMRVLLLAGDGVETGAAQPEAGAPVAAPAAPKSEAAAASPPAPARAAGARKKPAAQAVPRVRLVEQGPAPSPGEAPARVASLAPGAAAPASEMAGAERDRRLALIQARIQQALFYPRVARRRGIEGTVHVRFGIRQDGRVNGLAIARSSGHRLLDRASLETVERAQPLPFIDGALEVPVVFHLSGRR